MRFDEELNWSEGLFLQPHHLQRFQRLALTRDRNYRALSLAFPSGLIDFEIDENSLVNNRVVVKRCSALMPGGEELSMPGNMTLAPLDVSEELAARETFTVQLALPAWSDCDANLTEDGSAKRQYMVREMKAFDENTGDNEVEVAVKRYNARLTTDRRDNADLDVMPVLRLRVRSREGSEARLEVDREYLPPFVVLTPDCPLVMMTEELLEQMRNRRAHLLQELADESFSKDSLTGSVLYSVLQLKSINVYGGRISSMVAAGGATPFALYLELKALLGELSALQPLRSVEQPSYRHLDMGPVFAELFMQIRALILAEGVASYARLPFESRPAGGGATVHLRDEHVINADDYYLAIRCEGDARKVVAAVEHGDNIRLVNPRAATLRVRGVKLVEVRYPPRFLPAVPGTVWFRLVRNESQRIWDDITVEREMLLDWADDVFPQLEAELFVTIVSRN